jgi:hypothetical protein
MDMNLHVFLEVVKFFLKLLGVNAEALLLSTILPVHFYFDSITHVFFSFQLEPLSIIKN